MARDNWKEFRNGFSGQFFQKAIDSGLSYPVGGSGITCLHSELSSGGTVPKIYGMLYNGPESGGLPTKYCSITMMIRGGVATPSSYRIGPIISTALIGDTGFYKGTPTPNANINLVMCGLNDNPGAGAPINIQTRRIANGAVVAGSEQSAPLPPLVFIGGTSWRHFEISFLLDDLVPTQERFRIFYRINNGPNATLPGSVGWTNWILLAEYNYTTELIAPGINVAGGFFPGFGFHVSSTSTAWASPNSVEIDDVIITNYTVVPP